MIRFSVRSVESISKWKPNARISVCWVPHSSFSPMSSSRFFASSSFTRDSSLAFFRSYHASPTDSSYTLPVPRHPKCHRSRLRPFTTQSIEAQHTPPISDTRQTILEQKQESEEDEEAMDEDNKEEPVTVPGAAWPIDPAFYEEQLASKLAAVKALFANLNIPEIEVFRSPPLHYRMRAEFKVSRRGGRYHYVMNDPITHHKVDVGKFLPGTLLLNEVMKGVLEGLETHPVLGHRMFGVRLYSTLSGKGMVTFLYNVPLSSEWNAAACAMRASFAAAGLDVNVIGRSRKYVEVAGNRYVDEVLNVRGVNYTYRQYESEFSQPNAIVNQHMLGWAQKTVEELELSHTDLVELYCGNGNFTLPVAGHFRRVCATELSPVGLIAAKHNLETAKITNVSLVRLPAMDFSKSLRNLRKPSPFTRADRHGLAGFNFQTALLDPPRPGADAGTLAVLEDTPNVIYISCNPLTLHSNLMSLAHTHTIRRFAAFDQFPYTHHLECGVMLGPKKT